MKLKHQATSMINFTILFFGILDLCNLRVTLLVNIRKLMQLKEKAIRSNRLYLLLFDISLATSDGCKFNWSIERVLGCVKIRCGLTLLILFCSGCWSIGIVRWKGSVWCGWNSEQARKLGNYSSCWKDRNFNSKWSNVVQRCIVMLDRVLIILLKGSILPCNLLDSVVLAISREISLVIFCYKVFECIFL